MSIDRIARREFAVVLQGLRDGTITNEEFQNDVDAIAGKTADPAVKEIRHAAWTLYGDHRRYYPGTKFSEATKSELARWILFLERDYPYEWPSITYDPISVLKNWITFGGVSREWRRRASQVGDIDAWPFVSTQQEIAAKHHT